VTTDRGGPPPRVGKSVTRRAGSSALLSARSVSGAPAFLSPLGGSRFPVAATSERRPDTQITPPIRLRTDQAVAKCLSLLARLELGDDLPCPTVDDNECLQGTEFWRRTHQTPGPSMLTKRVAQRGIDATKKRVAVRPESDGEYCLLRSVDRDAASLTHNRTCCGTRARQRISAFSKSAPGVRHARSEARFRGRAIPSQRIPSPEVPQFTDVADPGRETNLSHTLARNPRGYRGRGSFEGAALTGEPRWRLRRHQRVPGEGQPPVSTLRLPARRSFRVSWIPAGLLRPTELASATATSSAGDPKKSAAPARNLRGARRPRRRWHENGLSSRLGRLSLVGVWV
jgi:hypothetical protein